MEMDWEHFCNTYHNCLDMGFMVIVVVFFLLCFQTKREQRAHSNTPIQCIQTHTNLAFIYGGKALRLHSEWGRERDDEMSNNKKICPNINTRMNQAKQNQRRTINQMHYTTKTVLNITEMMAMKAWNTKGWRSISGRFVLHSPRLPIHIVFGFQVPFIGFSREWDGGYAL